MPLHAVMVMVLSNDGQKKGIFMSSVDSVNGLDGNLYEILIQAAKGSQPADSAAVAAPVGGVAGAQGIPGGNEGGIDDLRTKIDSAISEALAGLDKSASTDDIMAAVQKAVSSTMEANGVDPSKMPPPPPPPPAEKSSETSDDEDDDTSTSNDPFLQRLQELLDENGFDGESIISQLEAQMSGQDTSSMFSLMQGIQSQQGIDKTV
jgi:hypothetical protein